MASETERGSAWAESALKELTGNEGPVSARKPRGEPFNYKMQAKIIILGNHAPNIRGQSSGMERRLRVIPFRNKPARRDETLKERLRAEYPAILRWVIDGCLAWQRDGLGTCTAVSAASAAYFEDQDSLRAWANERLDIGAACRAKRTDLFTDFNQWCRQNGETPPTSREFYESMRRSFAATDTAMRGVWHMRGVGFKEQTERGISPAEISDFAAMLH
jgi:putative DNA primase/helicase